VDNTVSRSQLLSVLGIGPDPDRSLTWYVENVSDMYAQPRACIAADAVNDGIFPAEAHGMTARSRCRSFSQVLYRSANNTYCIATNDTDRGTVSSETPFCCLEEAITSFVLHANCAGGSPAAFFIL